MAITWGAAVADATNAFRIGYEFSQSPATVANSTTSVTVTLKIYLGTKYNAWDSGVSWAISGNISSSGSTSFNHTSGTAWSSSNVTLLATKTRTVTPSFTSTVATSISASVTGLSAIAGTATVSGTWTTAKRPIVAPDAPTGLTLTRVSDSQTNLSWSNTNPSDASAPYTNVKVERYDWAVGAYVEIASLGVVTSYSATGQTADAKYSYRVRATNSAGGSGYSAAGPIATTPDAPSTPSAVRNVNDIDVNWTNNAAYASQWEVWHRLNGVLDGAPLATVSTTSYKHVAPSTSQPHSYEIKAKITDVSLGVLTSAASGTSTAIQLADNPPGAVSAVTPATGTVTKPNPTLGLTLASISTGQTQKGQWQFATNTGFTSNVQTVTEADGDLRLSGATTENPTLAQLKMSNGTWYMRARAIDRNGVTGPWSATATLTVNTPVPPTPTGVGIGGATITTMYPTLAATVVADAAGRLQKIEWNISQSATFASGVKSIVEEDADLRASGATSEVISSISQSPTINGTWYVRARALAEDGAVGAWSANVTFTLALTALSAPSALTPADLATVSTDFPTLSATLAAASESRRVKAEWQLASNNTFASNLKTITENNSDLRTSGQTTEPVPANLGLFQGTWYMRARTVDEFGNTGAWSGTQSFIVSHKPVANPSAPANDSTTAYGTTAFGWTFSDPETTDTQTAYQIIIERNDTGASLYDSGKVVSALKSASVGTGSMLKDIKMRWKIRVWDSDDVVGNYSAYQLFTLSDAPVVTITSPTAAQQIGTGQPTITWNNDAGTSQASFRVTFKRTSDNAVIFDSGLVSTSVQSYTAPTTILENQEAYSVTVVVTDTQGLVGSATQNFTTSYQVPDPVYYTVSAAEYDELGYISIDWSATPVDDFFVQWNVYRRKDQELTWELIGAYTDSSIIYHRDWTATAGDIWEYAVTQSAGRSGVVLESPISAIPESVTADGSHYWLMNPYDETNNLKLENVASDSFTDVYEEAELVIIGRGRKINTGTHLGYEGSMQARLRDDANETARSKRKRLQLIKSATVAYYLRTPFGDIFQVAVGNLAIDRLAGVGTSEFVDVTIPYKEVY